MSAQQFAYDDDTYSDLYKDVYGFRPRGSTYGRWAAMTCEEKQEEWNSLCESLDRVIKEEEARKQEAILAFEQRVDATIACGAENRETAIRWIRQTVEWAYDWDHVCYEFGLPYGYFKEMA